MLLFLPIYTTQAGGEFGSMCFMMRDTLAALSVSGTSLFRTRAIDIIMWTWHVFNIFDFRIDQLWRIFLVQKVFYL